MSVLRTRGFPVLLAGEVVNATGNWIAIVAIWGFASFKFDAGAADLALLFVVLSVPGAFFGPLLGVPIDRLGPKRMLLVANLLGVVDALALTQAKSYLQIVLLALPLGLIEALAAASLDAIPPRLVPDGELVAANALLGGAQDVAIVIGPIIAALVNAHWGLSGAFLADAGTFAVGALVALTVSVGPAERREARESPWRELRAGLTLARRRDGLRWTLTAMGSVYLLWALFGLLEPLYVRDVLGESDSVFALFQTTYGVGLVLTGLALAKIGDRIARPRYVAIAAVAVRLDCRVVRRHHLVGGRAGRRVPVGGRRGVLLRAGQDAFAAVRAPAFHGRILSLNQSLEPLAGMVITPIGALALGLVSVQVLGVAGGGLTIVGGLLLWRWARGLSAVPAGGPVDPTAGTACDAIALGGSAPG